MHELEVVDDGRLRAMTFQVAWPPSVNHTYVNSRRRGRIRDPKVQRWARDEAWSIIDELGRTGQPRTCGDSECMVFVTLFPPDRRKRDIDNPIKALLDVLARAGLMDDDQQVHTLVVMRLAPEPPEGRVEVSIRWHEDRTDPLEQAARAFGVES